ncbi:hypothetical protein [Pseudomonas cichorii]|uniref:hypothetical protein n=1 Tax=Pseudomonas cichorii TaxID=36746 RepID=UPI001C89854C|nr:hypothetical protein [Pseudomonas cichorii]MBX8497018.1 hypothetical protein [Pseudomonas cichorii]
MSLVREGVVVGGEYSGWSIFIDDDREGETGGYYLYLKKDNVQGGAIIGLNLRRVFGFN